MVVKNLPQCQDYDEASVIILVIRVATGKMEWSGQQDTKGQCLPIPWDQDVTG